MLETSDLSIGVIIPVYNRHAELKQAIASVLSQTRRPEEIVVVDDGSNPPISLPSFEKTNTKITLIRLCQNQGPAAARQAALESLRTSHIAFLDSDDQWMPDKLEAQTACFKMLGRSRERDFTAISCGWQLEEPNGTTLATRMPVGSNETADFCSGCWYCPGSTVLVPRIALMQIGGFDKRLRRLEDFDLFLRFAMSGGRLEVIRQIGARIRRGRNASRDHVDLAADLLRKKYLDRTESHPHLKAPNLRRRLISWLAVEEAAAAFNERQYFRAGSRMSYSLMLKPRLRVQLEQWWNPTV